MDLIDTPSERELVLGIILLSFSLIFIIIINDIFQIAAITISPVVPAGIGALGTLLLAWVTVRTLEQNEDLVQHQEAQLRPAIRQVGDFTGFDRDNLKIELENIGYGKAINMHVTTEIYIRKFEDEEDCDIEPYPSLPEYSKHIAPDLPNIESGRTPLYLDSKNIGIISGSGGVLESGNQKKFSFRVDFSNADAPPFKPPSSSEYPPVIVFSKLIGILKDHSVEESGFRFVITYEDVLGNEFEDTIAGPLFDPNDVSTIEDSLGQPFWILKADKAMHEIDKNNG